MRADTFILFLLDPFLLCGSDYGSSCIQKYEPTSCTDMHETRMLKGTGPRNRTKKLRQKWIIGSNKEPLVFELWRWNLMICVFCIFLLQQAAMVKYMWEKIGVYCQITWRPSLFPVGLLDAFLILLFGNCSICNLIVWLGGPQQNEDIFFVWRWNLFWQKPIQV